MILIFGINIIYAKDINTYCFESPYIFIGEKHVKKLYLTFDDNNFSMEYQMDIPLYFTLDNGKTYITDPPNCYYEGNETFNCNQELDGAGYLEFDSKKKRINIEHLCIFECYVHMMDNLYISFEDGTVIMMDALIEGEAQDDNKSFYSFYKEGDLNTISNFKSINDENEKTWVQGYKCDSPINLGKSDENFIRL